MHILWIPRNKLHSYAELAYIYFFSNSENCNDFILQKGYLFFLKATQKCIAILYRGFYIPKQIKNYPPEKLQTSELTIFLYFQFFEFSPPQKKKKN